jgi:hypothetical protein
MTSRAATAVTLEQRTQALLTGAPGVNVMSRADALRYRVNIAGGRAGAGTAVTDFQAIQDVIGPFGGTSRLLITIDQAAALEKALGLPTSRLSNGGIISVVDGIAGRAPRSPLSGNKLFIGGGRGLPGGGPEINVAPIATAGGGGVRQIILEVK